MAGCEPDRFVVCELTDAEAVNRMFAALKPRVCIHCAALSDPDICEHNPELCDLINVKATKNLCQAAERYAVRLILCSTDYVFGNEKEVYSELDVTAPLQTYGRSKVRAEQLVLGTKRSVVLRLPLLYGASGKFFVASVQSTISDDRAFVADNTTARYPLYIPDIAPPLQRLLDRPEYEGIFHLSGPEAITKLEWAGIIAATYTKKPVFVGATSEQTDRVANRPGSIRLDDQKARNLLQFSPRSLSEGTRNALQILELRDRDAF